MQRQAVSESRNRVATYETRDSVKEEKVVAEHDTVMEVTTIHVQTNEAGDTVFRSVVTDRTRAASRDNIAAYRTKTVIKTDTVFVERRDSVAIRCRDGDFQSGGTALHTTLRMIFLIVISLIVLVIVLKFRRI